MLTVSVTFYIFNTFILSDGKKTVPANKNKIQVIGDRTPKPGGQETPLLDFSVKSAIRRVDMNTMMHSGVLTKWKRDPFLGAFTPDILDSLQKREKVEPFVLKAISWRDSVAYVIINNDVYREGEQKNGIHVIDVVGNKVIYSFNGKKSILRFGE